jgi:hypothetical protein
LLFRQLEDELLVHDMNADITHCLDRAAALILRHSDGETTIGELRTIVERETGRPLPADALWVALEQLSAGGLFEKGSMAPTKFDGLSRRAMLKRVGATAAAVPIITFVAAQPALAQTVSCTPDICTCFGSFSIGQTCSGINGCGGSCTTCTVNSSCIPQEVGPAACNGVCS